MLWVWCAWRLQPGDCRWIVPMLTDIMRLLLWCGHAMHHAGSDAATDSRDPEGSEDGGDASDPELQQQECPTDH